MGGRAGKGLGLASNVRRQLKFQEGLSALQAQYEIARKKYNSIKKSLGWRNKYVSIGHYADRIMKKQGLKTPYEIKQEINDHIKNYYGPF